MVFQIRLLFRLCFHYQSQPAVRKCTFPYCIISWCLNENNETGNSKLSKQSCSCFLSTAEYNTLMLGRELLFSEEAGWMSTQNIKRSLGSRWCRALILVLPGLLAATSCPLSVKWWRQSERQSTNTEGEREKGVAFKRSGRETKGKEERKEDRRKAWWASCLETALTHMLLISRGEKRGGVALKERVGDRSSGTAQQLVCVCAWLLSLCCNGRHMSVWQRRQKECYRATEAGNCAPAFGRWNKVSAEKTDRSWTEE